MKRTDVIIIGGGQAGLAMSRCLADRGIDHVIIERGRVAERWRSERWDSLRLLSPRWQSRLPSWSYRGPDQDGFMAKTEVIGYLDNYARSFDAPLHTGVTVTAVERKPEGFKVQTDADAWHAANVVIATGYCDRPNVPSMAAAISAGIAQVAPTRYRNPEQLPDGGVLVVGASSTGIQLASEIARSGRSVTLSVGRHIRLPRRYRGTDIMAWFESMGVLSETTSQVFDVAASRRQPSLQLIGSDDHRSLDLNMLQDQGVCIVGSLKGASDRHLYFEDDLTASVNHADVKMHKQLDRVDDFIVRSGLDTEYSSEDRPQRIRIPEIKPVIDLDAEGIGTVLWATGYRREYPWLRVPVLNSNGEIEHDGGVTRQPGLYALGLHFMRRRNSSFIDGVGADAVDLTEHIVSRTARRYMAVA